MQRSPDKRNSPDKKSPRNKPLNKKDKEKLKERYRREAEQARVQEEKNQAQQQLERLKETGIVTAYEQFLRNMCKNGLPDPGNVYELAAQFVIKYDKKNKEKRAKKEAMEERKQVRRVESPNKSINSERKSVEFGEFKR